MTLELFCPCVTDHVPNTKVLHRHHIVPKAWGGSDEYPAVYDGANLVAICPTSHENIHKLLNEYVRHQVQPDWGYRGHFTIMERRLAQIAWEWWVANVGDDQKPPWTMPAGAELVDIDQENP